MKTNNKKVEDKFYGKRVVKGIFAKAKFSHLSTMLDMLDYQSANDQEDLAKKNIKGLAQSIGKLNPTKDEWSRYVKIAKSLGFSESQISGFARTGSKARFAMSVSYDSATELLTVGNKHYKCSRSQSGYVLNVLRNVRNAKNPSNEQARAIDEFQREGIISITDKTYNSKAKFANEEIARGLSKVLKANGFDAMASQVLSGSTDSETLRKYIRALKSKMSPMSGNDRGMVLLQTLEKQLASRTGAKAKFAIKKIKDLGNGWVVEEATGNDAFNPSATELYLTKGSKTIPVESLKHAIETYNDLITGKKGIYK